MMLAAAVEQGGALAGGSPGLALVAGLVGGMGIGLFLGVLVSHRDARERRSEWPPLHAVTAPRRDAAPPFVQPVSHVRLPDVNSVR